MVCACVSGDYYNVHRVTGDRPTSRWSLLRVPTLAALYLIWQDTKHAAVTWHSQPLYWCLRNRPLMYKRCICRVTQARAVRLPLNNHYKYQNQFLTMLVTEFIHNKTFESTQSGYIVYKERARAVPINLRRFLILLMLEYCYIVRIGMCIHNVNIIAYGSRGVWKLSRYDT